MSSPFLAKFFITQVLLFQPINIHGFLYKECPWSLSSNAEPFFIALMTPLLSWFGYSYTEFSYRIVHLCTGRLPMGLASQSVTQQEDTYPAATQDIMHLYSSPLPPGIAQQVGHRQIHIISQPQACVLLWLFPSD